MKGRPFEPGNKMGKGRPPGSKNKKSIFQQELESRGLAIIKQLECQALMPKPDSAALRWCGDRLIAPRKASDSPFHMRKVETIGDVVKATSEILQEIAKGHLSPEDGESVIRSIAVQTKNMEVLDYETRMGAAEKKIKQLLRKRHGT